MTAKHTPGPWIATCIGVVEQKTGEVIAAMGERDSRSEEVSNADLISAAPDLLLALQDAIKIIESTGLDCGKLARAAIAKATGQ